MSVHTVKRHFLRMNCALWLVQCCFCALSPSPLQHFLFFHGMLRFVFLFGFQLLHHSLHHLMTGDSICGGKVKVRTVF